MPLGIKCADMAEFDAVNGAVKAAYYSAVLYAHFDKWAEPVQSDKDELFCIVDGAVPYLSDALVSRVEPFALKPLPPLEA